ncbi:hypothetical protein jhhlp_003373 [Lomentospora prolificans]|uniref:Small nuclear ribonucleoprotein Prp3 C-terminal domain-containing protein n=1 Tax=Lomentospora prolificans TaxID=41688 RepID=A0A2N3NC85_9PEZI|nr:hypothetical protein jhhlp_003373 [Lomentospora prolificans]
MSDVGCNVLPKDLMELQLGQIDLLMAMYEPDKAISLGATSSEVLDAVRDWCEGDEDIAPQLTDTCITMVLDLEVSSGDNEDQPKPLRLTLAVPLVAEAAILEPPPVKTRLHQPTWMSKGDVARLTTELPNEDILSVIEYIKESASQYLAGLRNAGTSNNRPELDAPIVRAWFYFPSIITREKRDDLVNCACPYNLTGFLLAGKPGILCLEGRSVAIDDFMKFIKTESWGNIPPQHKKVSERYREEVPNLKRAFKDMREITDMIGEKRGERANRSDMKALKAWLGERGLGEAFEKVLM